MGSIYQAWSEFNGFREPRLSLAFAGDGHHGLRPGYHYVSSRSKQHRLHAWRFLLRHHTVMTLIMRFSQDYEHGPHYLEPRKVISWGNIVSNTWAMANNMGHPKPDF